MSTADYYYEPNKLPAGVLALLVHGVFFGLLYFGFSWQALPPATMSVELWQGLPGAADAPPAQARPEEVVQPATPEPKEVVQPAQPVEAIKPDIVLPDKTKDKAKPAAIKQEKKKIEAKPAAQGAATGIADQQATRERAEQNERNERAAAIGRVVSEYTGRIAAKIRSNIVMPPDVPDDARAEFSVTVLPGGSVLPPRLLKSSGNAAYDNAVERAILKSQPLPLPPDAAIFSNFREMKLGFRPKE